MLINHSDIEAMEQRFRATFINSLAGFRQAMLIGTKDLEGNSNLAIFNSLIHIGANPPLYGFISRPDTVKRDTLKNILDTQAYTINYVSTTDFKKAHQTSAKYASPISEFKEVGFTEVYLDGFPPPFVKEAVVKIGMKLVDKIEIKVNGTVLVIGSIELVEINEKIISKDGFVALEKEQVLASVGLDAYYSTQFLGRLSYAKPDVETTLLNP
jgi:flavin reductase (DIM6/NTAB) family NADH-FMN oxidoreductase RutF